MENVIPVNIKSDMASKLGLNAGDTLSILEIAGRFVAFPTVDYPEEVGEHVERIAQEARRTE